eukprot:1150391-Pelagomonas_calceolata.AAC.1
MVSMVIVTHTHTHVRLFTIRRNAQRNRTAKALIVKHLGSVARAVLVAWKAQAGKLARLKDIYGNLVHVTSERVSVQGQILFAPGKASTMQPKEVNLPHSHALLSAAAAKSRE